MSSVTNRWKMLPVGSVEQLSVMHVMHAGKIYFLVLNSSSESSEVEGEQVSGAVVVAGKSPFCQCCKQ
jgi:hypothetical protein